MAPIALPAEIWVLILPHLVRDVPAPVMRPRPARGALRNPDLIAALRTCKSICEPILYQTVLTDDIPLLLRDISKANVYSRFAKTETLHLEYSKKGMRAQYPQLLKSGGDLWTSFAAPTRVIEQRILAECEVEAKALLDSLMALHSVGMTKAFPKVKVVTVSMVYGSEQDGWRRFEGRTEEDAILIDNCRAAFGMVLRSSTTLRSLCIRDPAGPLSLSTIDYSTRRSGPRKLGYTTCIHFDRYVDHLPVPLGDKITWAFDDEMRDDWAEIVSRIGAQYERFTFARDADTENRRRREAVDVEIFCSTPKWGLSRFEAFPALRGGHGFSPMAHAINRTLQQQKSMAKELETTIQTMSRQKSGCQDVWKWDISANTPTCPACKSGAPK